jgi:hypothetical protein
MSYRTYFMGEKKSSSETVGDVPLNRYTRLERRLNIVDQNISKLEAREDHNIISKAVLKALYITRTRLQRKLEHCKSYK